uniref:hypothetical protein n=1 Tax=Streptomyces chartreusis TaxID=1969 RepID=UPI003F496D00
MSGLTTALTLWTHLFGLLGFEVLGRLNNMIDAGEEYVDHRAQVWQTWPPRHTRRRRQRGHGARVTA